jgi:hypothetical protein
MNAIVKRVLLGVAASAVIGVGAAYADRPGFAGGSFGGYAALDDTQKATFNEMGPRARFMHSRWQRDGGDGPQRG